MTIDYYGSFPCKVRDAISDIDLLRMEKARSRVNTVLNLMRNNPNVDKSKPESEWRFKTVLLGPNGPQETEMKVVDLLSEAAPLEVLSLNCRNCPKNIHANDFGCGGAIHYPISAQAEQWLLSRLPADLNTPAGKLLMHAITDFGYDGSCIDVARNRKDLYEIHTPLERKWGNFFTKKIKINSSQILHMAFGVGNLQSTHAKLVAYFLGFVDDDFNIVNDLANHPQISDDDRTIEMKYFFSIVALAGRDNASVLIDA